jgi:cyclic pyranopterin phosphate synthase
MVDVGGKDVTDRVAVAEAVLNLDTGPADALFGGDLPKGDALAVARVAAVLAVKRTPDLIPLAHPLEVTGTDVVIERIPAGARVQVTVRTTGRTGVEMEALTGAAAGALALYDMVKSLGRGAEIGPLRLLRKSGGRSGEWER